MSELLGADHTVEAARAQQCVQQRMRRTAGVRGAVGGLCGRRWLRWVVARVAAIGAAARRRVVIGVDRARVPADHAADALHEHKQQHQPSTDQHGWCFLWLFTFVCVCTQELTYLYVLCLWYVPRLIFIYVATKGSYFLVVLRTR